MKIKVSYYRKLPNFFMFDPEDLKRFSKEDQKKLKKVCYLKDLGYPIHREGGTTYLIEVAK